MVAACRERRLALLDEPPNDAAQRRDAHAIACLEDARYRARNPEGRRQITARLAALSPRR